MASVDGLATDETRHLLHDVVQSIGIASRALRELEKEMRIDEFRAETKAKLGSKFFSVLGMSWKLARRLRLPGMHDAAEPATQELRERPCSEDFRAAMKAVKIGNYGLLELEEKL